MLAQGKLLKNLFFLNKLQSNNSRHNLLKPFGLANSTSSSDSNNILVVPILYKQTFPKPFNNQ